MAQIREWMELAALGVEVLAVAIMVASSSSGPHAGSFTP